MPSARPKVERARSAERPKTVLQQIRHDPSYYLKNSVTPLQFRDTVARSLTLWFSFVVSLALLCPFFSLPPHQVFSQSQIMLHKV
jgi:hypothetical protein